MSCSSPVPNECENDSVCTCTEKQRKDHAQTRTLLKAGAVTAAAVAVGVTAVLTAPLALAAIGFTSTGILSGSIAASMMSAAATTNGGMIAAGSAVSLLQSAGAAGLGSAATGALAGSGALVGGGAAAALVAPSASASAQCPRCEKRMVKQYIIPPTTSNHADPNGNEDACSTHPLQPHHAYQLGEGSMSSTPLHPLHYPVNTIAAEERSETGLSHPPSILPQRQCADAVMGVGGSRVAGEDEGDAEVTQGGAVQRPIGGSHPEFVEPRHRLDLQLNGTHFVHSIQALAAQSFDGLTFKDLLESPHQIDRIASDVLERSLASVVPELGSLGVQVAGISRLSNGTFLAAFDAPTHAKLTAGTAKFLGTNASAKVGKKVVTAKRVGDALSLPSLAGIVMGCLHLLVHWDLACKVNRVLENTNHLLCAMESKRLATLQAVFECIKEIALDPRPGEQSDPRADRCKFKLKELRAEWVHDLLSFMHGLPDPDRALNGIRSALEQTEVSLEKQVTGIHNRLRHIGLCFKLEALLTAMLGDRTFLQVVVPQLEESMRDVASALPLHLIASSTKGELDALIAVLSDQQMRLQGECVPVEVFLR